MMWWQWVVVVLSVLALCAVGIKSGYDGGRHNGYQAGYKTGWKHAIRETEVEKR